MNFKDSTIKRYLHLVSVKINVSDYERDLFPTGWFQRLEHTIDYTRFSLLVYWPEFKSKISANALVKKHSNCSDSPTCTKCDGELNCLHCKDG